MFVDALERFREVQKNGASEETRTLDINLGKVALYQLSYTRSRNERWFYKVTGDSYQGWISLFFRLFHFYRLCERNFIRFDFYRIDFMSL